MSCRSAGRRRLAGVAAVLTLSALPLAPATAQAVPTLPGDTIVRRAAPVHPTWTGTGPIAPTLPGDTLMGNALSAGAAVPLHPIAPTMPGDVITRPPQWVLDTLRADSARQAEQGIQILPDAPERADSLRAEPPPSAEPRESRDQPRHPRRSDGIRRS